jgi:hypothetical protein
MKTIFLTAALVFAMGSNANSTTSTINCKTIAFEKQDKDYQKIETSKIPAAVKQEIDTKYEGYTISEAAASADSEYKVTLTKADKAVVVYYNSTGEFIKKTKL